MSLVYSFKEALSGFTKARISTVITIFTVFFLLSILGLVAIISFNMNRLVTVLNANHDLQVFLANTMTDVEIEQLKREILTMQGVLKINYISKQAAAVEFQKEFGDDIFDTLEENPLPASLIIQMKDDGSEQTHMDEIVESLEQRPEIDEVVMHKGTLDLLLKFSSVSRIVMYILLVLVFLGSFFMISNTIRLIILARQQIIATMKLVGATDAFIRRPFLFEGIIQGLSGGLFTFFAIYVIVNIINLQWPGLLVVPKLIYVAIILSGLFFGYVGSRFAIRRFL